MSMVNPRDMVKIGVLEKWPAIPIVFQPDIWAKWVVNLRHIHQSIQ